MLRRLWIKNYKSLHKVQVDLPQFATFVGANAAGKTNLADAVEFLSIVAKSGLPAAVTEKGGYANICFRRVRRAKGPIRFKISVEGIRVRAPRHRSNVELFYEYSFGFLATKGAIRSGFSVVEEKLSIKGRDEGDAQSPAPILDYECAPGSTNVAVREGELAKGLFFFPLDLLKQIVERRAAEPQDDLLLTSSLRGAPPFMFLTTELSTYRVFQIMPSYVRRAASASGSPEMGKYGENLPAALDVLSRYHPDAFEALLDYVRLAVPTVEKLETSYVETRELGLFLKEKGLPRQYASVLSDGTLRTIGIFLPLVDPRFSLIVMEEPENCIHPWVTRNFVQAAREMSSSRQIFITTHSPVLVSQLKPSELFVAERRDARSEILPVRKMGTEVDTIIRKGVMDLGTFWDSGAMRAVPAHPGLFEPGDR